MSISVLIPGIKVYLVSNSLKLIKGDAGFALRPFEGHLHVE